MMDERYILSLCQCLELLARIVNRILQAAPIARQPFSLWLVLSFMVLHNSALDLGGERVKLS